MDMEKSGQKNHYINVEMQLYLCGKCDKPISDADRQNGQWVAKYPSRKRRGYWLSQLMIPWVSAAKILDQKAQMNTQVFHNFVLGLPYQASEFMINRDSILRACEPQLANKTNVVIGCDSGKEKHWVMGNDKGVFSYGKTESWDDIEKLINMYNATCVIDALPDFTTPEALSRKYPGKVFVHYYSPDNSSSMDISRRKEGTDFGILRSDRTKLFDALAADIVGKNIKFFQTPKDLEDLIYHSEQAYRIVEPDTRGIMKARWETKVNRPDHWLHALAYYRVGLAFQIRDGEAGGVQSVHARGNRRSFTVIDGKMPVGKLIGDPDTFVERSLRANRRKRIK